MDRSSAIAATEEARPNPSRPRPRGVQLAPANDGADGAIPPCDLDAEGVVLSHCFEHGPIAGLLPRHFYSDANRYIYQAVTDLAARGLHPDPVSVARELQDAGRIPQVGGRTYILETIALRQPATAYPEQHAEAIRELYRRRVLSDVALELRTKLRAGQVSAAQAWGEFKRTCEETNEQGA